MAGHRGTTPCLGIPAIAARERVLIQPWLFLQTALVVVPVLTPPLHRCCAAVMAAPMLAERTQAAESAVKHGQR